MSGYGDRYRDPLDEAFGEETEAPREVAPAREPPYLSGLNKEQREAVEAVDGDATRVEFLRVNAESGELDPMVERRLVLGREPRVAFGGHQAGVRLPRLP